MNTILPLSLTALILGGACVLFYGPFLVAPGLTRTLLKGFPRNKIAGYGLTALGLFWLAALILPLDLANFSHLKKYVYVAGPVLCVVICIYLNELLAPRALGALLLLAAAPILDSARWHDSPLRLIVTVLAYVLVIKGIMLVLSPFRFREFAEKIGVTDARMRLAGVVGVVLGAMLLTLSFTVYRT